MKQKLFAIIALTILVSLLTVPAAAVHQVTTDHLTLTNAYENLSEEGQTFYWGENYVDITLTQDLWGLGVYYFNEELQDYQALPLYSSDEKGHLFLALDIDLFLEDSAETMDLFEWREAYSQGTLVMTTAPCYMAGSVISLRLPREYALFASDEAGNKLVYYIFVDDYDNLDYYDIEEGAEPAPIAYATSSTIYVNGVETQFSSYSIDNSNYFKLRDVAAAIAGTETQFSVDWMQESQAISLTSGGIYAPNGTELTPGDGLTKSYATTDATLFVDGTQTQLTAYSIDNSNYFKLRDLGQLFNFNVTWDGETNAILVDTTSSYSED
ncbi:MAG: hypothetical protein R3Y62_00855 [Eubacteriales bacterium]